MDENLIPFKVTLPGTILKEEIEANDLSLVQFAKKSGVAEPMLEKIIQGHEVITLELSSQISKVFGLSDDFWYKLQGRYDKHLTARATSTH